MNQVSSNSRGPAPAPSSSGPPVGEGVAFRLRARVLVPLDANTSELRGDWYLAVDEHGRVIESCAWSGQAVDEDLREGLLTPGFVDAHVHFPQTRAMGQATGPLLQWLEHSIFPEEARFGDLAYAKQVATGFAGELLRAGTTAAYVYGSSHLGATHELFSALEGVGLRAVAGPVLMDEGASPELLVDAAEAMAALEQLHERWHGAAGGRLSLAVIPRFTLCCSPSLLRAAGEFAATRALSISTHIAETRDEYAAACAREASADYLAAYEGYGLVGPRTVLAHCIHLSDGEWQRLANAGVSVAHCPDSNDFLGSGSMPTARALEVGAAIAVGSDVAAGRGFCMRAHLRAAFDCALRGGLRLPPEMLLWWGTVGGAEALGLPQSAPDAFAAGAWADFAYFHMPPWLDGAQGGARELVQALLFDPTHVTVAAVWAGGQRHQIS